MRMSQWLRQLLCDVPKPPSPNGSNRYSATRLRTLSSFCREDTGSVAITVAVCLTAILSIMGLAIDVGQLRLAKQRLQMTADAAALAGALELSSCGATSNCTALTTAAQSSLTENGLTGSVLLKNCAAGSSTQLTITVNNGPCALGSANADNGDTRFVETVISQPHSTYFIGVLGIKSVVITARAEAALAASKYCVYTLGTSGTDILLNGSANFTMQNCSVVDDSTSPQALLMNGPTQLNAKAIGIVGNYLLNGGTVSPTPTTGISAVGDPLSSLVAPTFTAGSCLANPVVNGSVTRTLGPAVAGGTVCYNGLTVNGGPTVTLTPGLYIINGAFISNMSSAGSISGTGVTFYFPVGGSYTDNGSGTLNLSAPLSGTYNGILFDQARSNTQQMTFNGSATSTLQGIFYLPSASLLLNGSVNTTLYTSLVVNSLTLNGSGTLKDYALVNHSSPLLSGAVLAQ
jgi:Flp pilus assembly protein TadG